MPVDVKERSQRSPLFCTTLHTVDNRNVVIPNGTLSNSNIVEFFCQ